MASTIVGPQSVSDRYPGTLISGGVPYSTDDVVAATFGPVEPIISPPTVHAAHHWENVARAAGGAGGARGGLPPLYDDQGRSHLVPSSPMEPIRNATVTRVSYSPPLSSSYYYPGAPSVTQQQWRYPASKSPFGSQPLRRYNAVPQASYSHTYTDGTFSALQGSSSRPAQRLSHLGIGARRDTETRVFGIGAVGANPLSATYTPNQVDYHTPTYYVGPSDSSIPGHRVAANSNALTYAAGPSHVEYVPSQARENMITAHPVREIVAHAGSPIFTVPHSAHTMPVAQSVMQQQQQQQQQQQAVDESSLIPLGAAVPPGTVSESLQPRRKKFLIKRHTAGCCGAFNRLGAFDRPAGTCSVLNCNGCCDREHITYAASNPTTLSEDGSIEAPRRAIRPSRITVCRGDIN